MKIYQKKDFLTELLHNVCEMLTHYDWTCNTLNEFPKADNIKMAKHNQ